MEINQKVHDVVKEAFSSIAEGTDNDCVWIVAETVDDAKDIARWFSMKGYDVARELDMQRDGWIETSITGCVVRYNGRRFGTRKMLLRSRRQYDEKIKRGGVVAGPVFRIDKEGNLLDTSIIKPWIPWFMKDEENESLEKYFDEILNVPDSGAPQRVSDF